MREKFNSKDIKLIISCLIISAVSIFYATSYFREAFPEAAIEMTLSKEGAKEKAEQFIANRGWDISDYMYGSRFDYHNDQKTFLERTLDPEDAGKIFNDHNGYLWNSRWFKPEQKEEFIIEYTTYGKLHLFEHNIADSTRGDSLTRDDAFQKATFYLSTTLNYDMNEWEEMEEKFEEKPHRYDYYFQWKETDFYKKNGVEPESITSSGTISTNGYQAVFSDTVDYNNINVDSEITVNNQTAFIVSKYNNTITLSDPLKWNADPFTYANPIPGTHRISIWVRGSEVSRFHEWIEGPETWERDYSNLRSKNWLFDNIGSFFLNVTILGILLVILFRMRKKDVRWKNAFAYGSVITVLLSLQAINYYPIQLSWVDNSQSLASLLFSKVLFDVIIQPLLLGLIISFLIAGAEVMYRDQYPDQLAFRNIFSSSGLQTKYFFNGTMLGLTLTFLFFAFQTIFYLISNHLGGWSPREVPDMNSLGTYIPWIGVLLGGLLPAILEETLSRMFTVSFLHKYTKSAFIAVFISSLIWGLAHASYPAQPAYIRVIEVGLGGIFIGIIFLRFGILPALIWHFTIDAFYNAFILLRSDNAYMFTSGLLCAGIFFLPLFYSLISYRKNGGFISSDSLVNALDTGMPEEKEEFDEIKPIEDYKPLSSSRKKIGFIIAGISLITILMFPYKSEFDNLVDFKTTRQEALITAQQYLNNENIDYSQFSTVIRDNDKITQDYNVVRTGWTVWMEGDSYEYIDYIKEYADETQQSSTNIINELYSKHISPFVWQVRFYKPGLEREYQINIDMKNNKVIGFEYKLADTTYLPFLTADAAENLAENELISSWGFDKTKYTLYKNSKDEKENRTDYDLSFQSENIIGEARYIYNVTVQGNQIGAVSKDLKLPEEWKRDYEKSTIFSISRFTYQVLFFLGFSILILFTTMKLLKTADPPWKYVFSLGALFTLIEALDYINDSTEFMWWYATETILSGYIVERILDPYLLGLCFNLLMCSIVILAVYVMWPGFYKSFKLNINKSIQKDSIISTIITIGFLGLTSIFGKLLILLFPEWIPISTFAESSDQHFPGFNLLLIILSGTPYYLLIAIIMFYFHRSYFLNKGVMTSKLIMILFFIFFMLSDPMNKEILLLPEMLNRFFWFSSFLILFRYFWRWNPWSYLLGIAVMWYGSDIIAYMGTHTHSTYQTQGWIVIGIGVIFFAYLTWKAFGSSSQEKPTLSS